LEQATSIELTITTDHNDIGLQSIEPDDGKPDSQVNAVADTVPVA
jgi:hypothetical protein